MHWPEAPHLIVQYHHLEFIIQYWMILRFCFIWTISVAVVENSRHWILILVSVLWVSEIELGTTTEKQKKVTACLQAATRQQPWREGLLARSNRSACMQMWKQDISSPSAQSVFFRSFNDPINGGLDILYIVEVSCYVDKPRKSLLLNMALRTETGGEDLLAINNTDLIF